MVGEELREESIFVEAVLELINKFLVRVRTGIALKLAVEVVKLHIARILGGISSGRLDGGLIELENFFQGGDSAIIVSCEIGNGLGGDRKVTKLKHR